MIPMVDLWMPIAVAAVAVFLTSWLLHMIMTYHRNEYRPLPKEAETLEALRHAGLTPGAYVFPHAKNPKEMGTPEMRQKYERGPVGMLSVWPSRVPNMGKSLGLWFVFTVLVSVIVACLAGRTHVPGASASAVFNFVGPAGFLAYALPEFVGPIWKGQTWSGALKLMFDGFLYSVVTAGVFAWLWPR